MTTATLPSLPKDSRRSPRRARAGVPTGDLVRRARHSTFMDFSPVAPQCKCGGELEVKDHRAPWYSPSASPEWRYEVRCKVCTYCDANGYQRRADVLRAYSSNIQAQPCGQNLPPT